MSSNQTYNIARGLVHPTSSGGGARRIIFTNKSSDSIVTRFVPGSGVGALNRSVKNYLYTHATPTRDIPATPACNCCATTDQAILTTAKAMVFNCMDFRLRENTTCNLNCKGYYNNYDEVISAGVSLGYNGLLSFSGWNSYIDSHITLGHILHNISEILIVEHCQCSAYAAQYGDRTISVPTTIGNVTKYPMSGSYLVQQHERELQAQNVQTCGTALWTKFNGTNGTLRQINGLTIIGYISSIDGCTLTEIYRKNS